MNFFTRPIIAVYSRLLVLYPRRFKNEFADEMQVVFRDSLDEVAHEGILPFLFVCLKEFGGLPFHILRELWHEIEGKEADMVTNEKTNSQSIFGEKTTRWDAFIGTLPFVLFGIASMIGKPTIPFLGIYAGLVFYVSVLLGLLIGLIKGVPRWTYSYLSWSLVFALWWSNMGTSGLKIFGFRIDHWTWQIWPPFFMAIGTALIWTRSLHPLRQLIRGIWQDWILISFTIYTLFASFLLGYDENRHPYLFLFMIASTIILSTSVWFFLRSIDTRKQVLSLLLGFVLAFAVSIICDATWDWHAYYGYPKPPAEAAYVSVLRYVAFLVFYGGILFLPSLLDVMRRASGIEE
jgi:hypothetical protein